MMGYGAESELRFTPPSAHCPRPDYWHSTDADSTEIEVSELVAGFVRALQPELVIETGTAWGQTAYEIGVALHINKHGELITLETDPERVMSSKKRCADLPVQVLHLSSLHFPLADNDTIGFAWFDSLIHLRALEFEHFHEWMVPGKTIVGFHDTGPQHGLKPEIEKLVVKGMIAPIFMPTPRGVCFAQVID